MKCRICNINEANQTGAHIFPAWMISSSFDEKSRNRDNEIIYNISPFSYNIPFFGRSVSPDKVKGELGRELSDEEIKNQTNILVVNNLWCRDCEKKIKVAEDYFLSNIENQTEDFSKEEEIKIKKFGNVNTQLLRLFFYSLIIRAHIARLGGVILNKKAETKIIRYFNKYLKLTLDETLNALANFPDKSQILSFPIRCIKTEKMENSTRAGVYIHHKYNKPYCFIINRYIMQFYCKGSSFNFSPNSFFGICDLISRQPNFLNYKKDIFYIGLMNLDTWKRFLKNIVDYHGKFKIEYLISLYRKIYLNQFKVYPTKVLITKFLNALVNNDTSLGVKYTPEKILEAMNKSIN
ncbi:MAG: hypothetical protein JW870_10950 [Candidatus Delongbacteria bacterium]|nr:hypothetical protein [Candidatus Delongbacteria bacterium]